MADLLFKDEVYAIVGAAMEVYMVLTNRPSLPPNTAHSAGRTPRLSTIN